MERNHPFPPLFSSWYIIGWVRLPVTIEAHRVLSSARSWEGESCESQVRVVQARREGSLKLRGRTKREWQLLERSHGVLVLGED